MEVACGREIVMDPNAVLGPVNTQIGNWTFGESPAGDTSPPGGETRP